MPLQKHLILVGPMGAGKSTIGRLLSEQLSCSFVDIDKEIEERSGATIPWIFDIEGEEGFRDRETQAIVEMCKEPPQIIATGGGCILRLQNRQCIVQSGVVIYLATSVEQQLQRTGRDKNRPLLQTQNPKKTLEAMAEIRNPLYSEVADLYIDTNLKPTKLVMQEILSFLEE
ncbi:shikimate kinase AroK [Reinekea forsetii]|nr:shikimate kinase AroK [Reinekea forsetii]